jgi:hypothetical protein
VNPAGPAAALQVVEELGSHAGTELGDRGRIEDHEMEIVHLDETR